MCTERELSIILENIENAYRNVYGNQIVRILLYGSYARGDFDQNSDIDIVALVRGERKKLQEELRQVWDVSEELELEYDTIVSPTVIPYDEFEKYKHVLLYYRMIQEEGVLIGKGE